MLLVRYDSSGRNRRFYDFIDRECETNIQVVKKQLQIFFSVSLYDSVHDITFAYTFWLKFVACTNYRARSQGARASASDMNAEIK